MNQDCELNVTRRRVLGAGIAAGSLFVPVPYAWVWAQSEGAMKLLRLPKIALVLGNSKYKDAPLRNPANDAKAIGDALKAAGFDVTAKLDAGRAEMAAAIQAYIDVQTRRKCVGLFYYAGHGIQLAWKNYMLPVDADIDTIEDVQKKAVEVNSLLEGLTKAGNALNVIILDACRDNPFGTAKQPQQKGLSQMDAPNSTLLAYATAPGNVASDGSGANGMYTENLLREMKVPDAKIEDVFKRVRLGVRRASNGQQVPWESTSLEEDFWFQPPAELKKLSDAEKEKLFKEELALWEKIRRSTDPKPLEDYLRRYPSGEFTELAELQLDRILAIRGEKKIKIASAKGNPYTKGSASADIGWAPGDVYTYTMSGLVDPKTKVENRTLTFQITKVTDDEVHYSTGLITDLLGNVLRTSDGIVHTPNQTGPQEFTVGKRWSTRYLTTGKGGYVNDNEANLRIATRESVTVPAGTFNAFRLDTHSTGIGAAGRGETVTKTWYAPELLRRFVAYESRRTWNRQLTQSLRLELVSFKEANKP